MIICRTIEGTPCIIELTDEELYAAYKEKEHIYDISYVRSLVPEGTPETMIDAIAYEMRRNIMKYDMEISYAFDEATSIFLTDEEIFGEPLPA